MKIWKKRPGIPLFFTGAILLCAGPATSTAAAVWNATNNISANTNWSTAVNWSGGVPIAVCQGAGTSGSQRATLDMSGLGLFNATVSTLQVGVQGVTHPTGTLLLARTNSITASGSTGIQMGQASDNGTASSSFIYLGLTNAIRANTI